MNGGAIVPLILAAVENGVALSFQSVDRGGMQFLEVVAVRNDDTTGYKHTQIRRLSFREIGLPCGDEVLERSIKEVSRLCYDKTSK